MPSVGRPQPDPPTPRQAAQLLNLVWEEDEEFGPRRLCDVVREYRQQTARAIVDAIYDAVAAFQRGTPPHDDMTAVAVKIVGKGEIKRA